MDFIPLPNRDDFKDQKEYEAAVKEWEEEFKKFTSDNGFVIEYRESVDGFIR